MPSLRFTRRTIDEVPFTDSAQVVYRDTTPSGFGFRPDNRSKVFFAERLEKGRS